MPVLSNNVVREVLLSDEQKVLVEKANKVFLDNFGKDVWFGRCVFLSWYCSKGTCDFCFRSTQKHKIAFAENARRSKESVYSEAIISKVCDWKLEFLTGGYDVYSFEELLMAAKICSEIFEEKIWINLGVLKKEELLALKPYVEGVVASLETVNEELHNKTCPDKPLQPYLDMLKEVEELGFKKGITVVLGLGESIKDYELTKKLIFDYKIDRITYYALRPVRGTPYSNGPAPEDVVEWIARTRIDFPLIEIMAGTAVSRIPEIKFFLEAGANGFTKLPATNIFGSSTAKELSVQAEQAGRILRSNFLSLDFSFEKIVNNLSLGVVEKKALLKKLSDYHTRMTSRS
ncbi:radical SAM protein [Candidatus Woesearchaeota archaeon]|nr:radical SAM protein [Candidatus Woesearchaeota archaeon]